MASGSVHSGTPDLGLGHVGMECWRAMSPMAVGMMRRGQWLWSVWHVMPGEILGEPQGLVIQNMLSSEISVKSVLVDMYFEQG